MKTAVVLRSSMLFTMLISLCAFGQEPEPGTVPWTPTEHIGLVRTTIEVPAKYSSLNLNPNIHVIEIPQGWTAKVFHAGASLGKPRFMSWGPDSVLYVANMTRNNILALPDNDGDGVADTVLQAATGFSTGHDVRFYHDTMFVAQEAGVEKLWRTSGSGFTFDGRIRLIDKSQQPNQTGGNHRTRTVVLDTNTFKIYVSVGSRGNADRETNRALIEQYDWDGSNRRVYASGVRNAVGMTLHPRTGKLWANNNGSDLQGNDVPPEWVDIVRDEGFYGYPFSYHYRRWFNFEVTDYKDLKPITLTDSQAVASMRPPAALVSSHSAPMALVFAPETMPQQWRSGAFMVMRGSWNRSPMSGAKVIFLEFDNDADTIANVARDFCTGFATDSMNTATRWARPVGLAIDSKGAVYISLDDPALKQFILKLTPPASTSVDDESSTGQLDFHLMPNPSSGRCKIRSATSDRFTVPSISDMSLTIRDMQGRLIMQQRLLDLSAEFDTSSFSEAVYYVTLSNSLHSVSKMLCVIR